MRKLLLLQVPVVAVFISLLFYVVIDSTDYRHHKTSDNVIFVDAFFTTTTTTTLPSQHYRRLRYRHRDDEDAIVRQRRKQTSAFASDFSVNLIRMMMSSSTTTTVEEQEASTELLRDNVQVQVQVQVQEELLLMEPIINHPSIQLLHLHTRPRKKLKPRHKKYFCLTNNSTTTTTDNNNTTCCRQISLFEKIALACCDSSVVPRKELYETYAAAILIHNQFRDDNTFRIADLAAGHGLLSWMLLAIYNEYDNNEYEEKKGDNNSTNTNTNIIPRRTAICIDLRMPPSAIAIAKSMRKHFFPVLLIDNKGNNADDDDDDDDDGDESLLYDRRWTYVQTGLQDIVTDSSTLLASVHACGTLTDYLIEMAIKSNYAPLALVPCCHTYSIRKGYKPHPIYSNNITAADVAYCIEKQQQEEEEEENGGSSSSTSTSTSTKTTYKNKKFQIIENVIDNVRLITLQNAYGLNDVVIQTLPEIFTERNRLFLVHKKKKSKSTTINNVTTSSDSNSDDRDCRPSSSSTSSSSEPSSESSKPITITTATARKGSMPQPQQKVIAAQKQKQKQQLLLVPLKDDIDSIDYCVSISGTEKSYQRLRQLIPNHFTPKLDVSMWISSSSPSTESKLKSKPHPLIIDSTNTTTNINTNNNVNKKENNNNNNTVTVEMLQEVLDETVRNYIRHYHHHNGLGDNLKEIGIDCEGDESSSSRNNNNSNNNVCYCSCTICAINELYVDPKTGRVSCTYQIEYTTTTTTNSNSNNNNNNIIDSNSSRKSIIPPPIFSSSNFLNDDGSFPKKIAKEIHELFCHEVVRAIDGVEIR
jgi:hypothetical protein